VDSGKLTEKSAAQVMSEAFDPEKYEQLRGLKLGLYAVEVAKTGNLPSNCIDYFRSNAGRWDGQHLEMGLFFLSKLESDAARHEIAKHLDHPLKHIRFTVLMFLDRLQQPDHFVVGKLRERLWAETEDFESRWIKDVYDKATKRIQSGQQ
jgi:hypothetical protein